MFLLCRGKKEGSKTHQDLMLFNVIDDGGRAFGGQKWSLVTQSITPGPLEAKSGPILSKIALPATGGQKNSFFSRNSAPGPLDEKNGHWCKKKTLGPWRPKMVLLYQKQYSWLLGAKNVPIL